MVHNEHWYHHPCMIKVTQSTTEQYTICIDTISTGSLFIGRYHHYCWSHLSLCNHYSPIIKAPSLDTVAIRTCQIKVEYGHKNPGYLFFHRWHQHLFTKVSHYDLNISLPKCLSSTTIPPSFRLHPLTLWLSERVRSSLSTDTKILDTYLFTDGISISLPKCLTVT